jgi:hypothetical protein
VIIMTTINSTVFSGLTGAAPLLLSRAVALINNSGLTSLEPLRQALANGSTVVRAATAADMVPPGVHATFRDPVRDPQTLAILKLGEIIVRTEYLTSVSDPAVLQFVDDIFHEGVGHGAQIRGDARADANNALVVNQDGLSTTDRGDAYVKAWIDDETAARYTAYTFRKELATLNTEYSASNRAILATDDTFKELARLDSVASGMGLTGTDKADYVIAQARPVVAAYNNHFYRDAGSKYVIETLHLNGTPEGTAYDAHVKATFNLVGYVVTDVVMHDDNSSSASVIYENGDRRDVVFDSSGSLYEEHRAAANGDSTTTRYDTSGHATQVTETDGAQNNADYSTRFTAYDAQGRTDFTDLYRDDGTRDRTDNDQNGSQNWTRLDSHFDAQGREDYRTATLDDGGKDWTDFDQSNARGDSVWSNHTDAQGREDWRLIAQDDGGKDWIDFDQSNTRGDSVWSNHTDAQGREDWRAIAQDDGRRDRTDFDQDGAQGWSRIESHFDAQGREDNASAFMDDGSRNAYDYDQDSSQVWSRVESHLDAQGREDSANVFMDDGSRNAYDYDQDGSQGWSRVEARFDAQGREDNANAFMDDGSRNSFDYDQDGSQGWSRVAAHFDAQGREDGANMFMDDGSRNTFDYDQDGTQNWNRVEARFDSQGREDSANMFMDNGCRNAYDYDQDGSHGWSRIVTNFNAWGQQDYAQRSFDDGSRLFVDYDFYGLGQHQLIGYNAFGQGVFFGTQVKGVVVGVTGTWKTAFGEGLGVQAVIPASSSGPTQQSPFASPTWTPEYDPYPNAHVELGPLERVW